MAAPSRAGVGRNSALEARVAVWCGWFSHAPEHAAFAEGTYWAFPAAGVMRLLLLEDLQR
jgi:hypothetical protein